MQSKVLAAPTEQRLEWLHLRVAWLCGVVLFLEGYDIAAVGYAIPSLVDAWRVPATAFTQALTAGNVGLLFGSLCAGLLGDRLGRKPVLIFVRGRLRYLLPSLSTRRLAVAFGRPTTSNRVGPWRRHPARDRAGLRRFAAVDARAARHADKRGCSDRRCGWRILGKPAGARFPAIFVVGGILPLALSLPLVLWLPESLAPTAVTHRKNPVTALFREGLASSTVLLWAMNLLNLLFILLWMPAILHGTGVASSWAIFVTTLYGVGVIVGALLTAPIVDRVGVEPVLTWVLALGALCVLSIGLLNPPFWTLAVMICGAGVGIGGCQAGINSLSGSIYPQAIRSTGAGWALGAGRVGTIAGPLLGGMLLALGWRTQTIFIVLSVPAFSVALLMATLGRLRRS